MPKIPLLEGPEFPEPLDYLWLFFIEIVNGCAAGFGPAVITWNDLFAWCALTGETLDPWEARLLVDLGVLRANVLSEERPRDSKDKN